MNLIKYTVITSSALIVLSGLRTHYAFSAISDTTTAQNTAKQLEYACRAAPSSSLPSGSPPSGQTSSSSGLPSSQSGNRSSSIEVHQCQALWAMTATQALAAANPGDASEDGWLDGLPSASASGNGDWQTSNQSIPEGSGTEKSKPGGSGTVDDEPPAAEGDTELAEALSDLDGNILAERESATKNHRSGQ